VEFTIPVKFEADKPNKLFSKFMQYLVANRNLVLLCTRFSNCLFIGRPTQSAWGSARMLVALGHTEAATYAAVCPARQCHSVGLQFVPRSHISLKICSCESLLGILTSFLLADLRCVCRERFELYGLDSRHHLVSAPCRYHTELLPRCTREYRQ
jgi:hypothetical protein